MLTHIEHYLPQNALLFGQHCAGAMREMGVKENNKHRIASLPARDAAAIFVGEICMITPGYDQLAPRRDDEETMLYTVRELAEAAINKIGPYSPPRIQPTDVRVFFDRPPALHIRSWLVTIRHGHRFVVRIVFDTQEEQWDAQVMRWDVTPKLGVYHIKARIAVTAEEAPQEIEAIFHTASLIKGEPIGHAVLVGKTREIPARAVYWLYEYGQPTDPLKRQIAGNYVLNERRFQLLSQQEITWLLPL